MKTSNKLIIAALLLLLVSLIAYDYKLKDAYDSGSYKNPYREFTTLKFKDFDAVDVTSSIAANVKFIQGPFKVIIDSNALEYVKVKQQGKRLQITVHFEHDYPFNHNPYVLVISCPKLVELYTNTLYTQDRKRVIDNELREEWNTRLVLMEGFEEDSLFIKQDYASAVVLSGNRIKSVRAVTGESPGSVSRLTVLKSNHFGHANIDILNNSSLFLNDAAIQNLSYHLADSARIIVNGVSQHLLNKTPKPQTK